MTTSETSWRFLVCLGCWALLWSGGCARGGGKPGPGDVTIAGKQTAKQRIDLALNDVAIHDALRELARKARINLSVDPDVRGTVTLEVHARPWDEVLGMIVEQHALRVERAGPLLRIVNASTPISPEQAYTGQPIEVRFEDTPIRSAAETFAELSGVKIVVDDDVHVGVTLRLRNLPWDLALDHLARKYELRIVRGKVLIRLTRP
jgi:type II secretory pathway component HofQ